MQERSVDVSGATARHVKVIVKAAVDEDQGEEKDAKDQQIRNLLDLQPQEIHGKFRPAECFVDNGLGQVQRQVKEWERQGRYRQKDDLLLLGVAEDVTENVGTYDTPSYILRQRWKLRFTDRRSGRLIFVPKAS